MAKKLKFINRKEKKEFEEFLEELFKECTKRSLFIPFLNTIEKEVIKEVLLFCFRKSKMVSIELSDLYDITTDLLAKVLNKCVSIREAMERNMHLYNMKIRYLGKAIVKRPIREKRILELTDKQKEFLYGRY